MIIDIIQRYPINKLDMLKQFELKINENLIRKDIEILELYLNSSENKNNIKNIKNIIKYLNKLIYSSDDNSIIEINNKDKNSIIVNNNIEFIMNREYNINTCNYIELNKDEKIIDIDTENIADIIAFDYIYRDIGETKENIESILSSCGLIGFECSGLLLDYFKQINIKPYSLSKVIKKEDSQYLNYTTKKLVDYFYETELNTYTEIIDLSLRKINRLIVYNILKNAPNLKLISSTENRIAFFSNSLNFEVPEVSIRVFGRKFKVDLKVTEI